MPWNMPKISILMMFLMFFLSGCNQHAQSNMPALTPEVSIVTLSEETVELSTELPGRTAPFRVAEIRPQVSGLILKRHFVEGSDVKAGQILYQIDPAPFEATLNSAKAALKKAEATVPNIKLRLERYKDLVQEKAISQQDLDDVSSNLRQAEAEVEYWKAAVESARINLNYTKIAAPIAGRVGKSNVTEGAIVTAYQSIPLTTIQQLDPIYVDVTQSTLELQQLKNRIREGRIKYGGSGQNKVRIILEDGTTYQKEGTFQFRDVTVDPSTGSIILRIVVPNPEYMLLPGMFLRAVVQEGLNEKALLVPQQAVTRDRKGNAIVMLVNEEGKVELRPIVTDRAIGNRWLVSAGLSPGDKVIVEGLQKVRPGMMVKAVPFKSSEESK